ncbi:MAG: Rieske 2Fe-2S domain-containing protein [Rhodospirillales bacterium]|nr:Rieske 2Fe-2S domain-containing protein [Rhodospirillales bacterium]
MLSAEDNEVLCRIGAGTPMGELFRQFWMPAILSSELEADGSPRRLRLLGEDLVAFRDSGGKVGILDAYCPHKMAPMFYGRNEKCGLTCIYHGWKFDVAGDCLELGNEPGGEDHKHKVKIRSYPVREISNLVWIFMGDENQIAEFPHLEWAHVDAKQSHVTRWLQRTNWAQGFEGEIDSSHISFLHRTMNQSLRGAAVGTSLAPAGIWDDAPELTLRETDYGFVYGARRRADENTYYWRMTQCMFPIFNQIANDVFPRSGRCWVPVDDYNVMAFSYVYNADGPITEKEAETLEAGAGFPPLRDYGPTELDDGYVIDTFISKNVRGNDYLIDRDVQSEGSYSGIYGLTNQDRALQENMKSGFGLGPGKIVDRSSEYLMTADVPVITFRKMIIKMAKDLAEKGIRPAASMDGSLYNVRAISAITDIETFDELLEVYGDECRGIVTPAMAAE